MSSVLRVDPEQSIGEQVSSLYEAVLHPRAVRSGEPVAIDAATLDRWVSLVESYGGTVHGDFLRTVGGGLTFVPVRVADADAPQLARFNRYGRCDRCPLSDRGLGSGCAVRAGFGPPLFRTPLLTSRLWRYSTAASAIRISLGCSQFR